MTNDLSGVTGTAFRLESKARIFLSYRSSEAEFAQRVAGALRAMGHTILYNDFDQPIGSNWRHELTAALVSSDVVVPLLTADALESKYILGEIGAARALALLPQCTQMLPVLVGLGQIPDFLRDLKVLEIGDKSDISVQKIAQIVNTSIQKLIHMHRWPRLFVSHLHSDRELVSALMKVITCAFTVNPTEVRCTSLRPYKLPVGARSADRLREEVSRAEIVFGIITPQATASSYVQFELGAAWGHGVRTCPLLACGAVASHVPSPISDLSPLTLNDEDDCWELVDDLRTEGLFPWVGSQATLEAPVKRLVEVAATVRDRLQRRASDLRPANRRSVSKRPEI